MIIVYAYVCGDILHKGHFLALRNAKSFGDKLIVGVLTDAAIMEKKPKPILPFEQRIDLISALKSVDCVVAQETYSPLKNVEEIKPDILMESTSHARDPEFEKAVEKLRCRIIRLPYYPGNSSTAIKEKIRAARNS